MEPAGWDLRVKSDSGGLEALKNLSHGSLSPRAQLYPQSLMWPLSMAVSVPYFRKDNPGFSFSPSTLVTSGTSCAEGTVLSIVVSSTLVLTRCQSHASAQMRQYKMSPDIISCHPGSYTCSWLKMARMGRCNVEERQKGR